MPSRVPLVAICLAFGVLIGAIGGTWGVKSLSTDESARVGPILLTPVSPWPPASKSPDDHRKQSRERADRKKQDRKTDSEGGKATEPSDKEETEGSQPSAPAEPAPAPAPVPVDDDSDETGDDAEEGDDDGEEGGDD
jgi:hypothetical protein